MTRIDRRTLLAGTGLVAVGSLGAFAAGPDPTFRTVTPTKGTWPQPRYGPHNTGHNPNADPPVSSPDVVWQQQTPGVSTLVLTEQAVIVGGSRHGNRGGRGVSVLDRATGEVLWSRDVGATSLCASGSSVYGLAEAGERIIALDVNTGDVRWQNAVPTEGSYILAGENALYLGLYGTLECRDLESGERHWRVDVAGSGRGFATQGLGHDRLYVTGPGPFNAFEPRTGPQALLQATPRTRWQVDGGLTGYGNSPPTVTEDAVILGETDPIQPTQTARAYDPDTGEELWRTPELGDSVHAPAVADDRAFVSAGTWTADEDEGTIVAVDLPSGEMDWRRAVDTPPVAAISAGDTVYAGSYRESGGPVYALDAASGDIRWSRQFESAPSTLVTAGSTLFVGTSGGRTYALAEE